MLTLIFSIQALGQKPEKAGPDRANSNLSKKTVYDVIMTRRDTWEQVPEQVNDVILTGS